MKKQRREIEKQKKKTMEENKKRKLRQNKDVEGPNQKHRTCVWPLDPLLVPSPQLSFRNVQRPVLVRNGPRRSFKSFGCAKNPSYHIFDT